MAKYIDAKALYEKLYDADAITIRGCEIFRGFPAADVAEVKRGEWVDGTTGYTCSVCHEQEPTKRFTYCPNCGAKMKG